MTAASFFGVAGAGESRASPASEDRTPAKSQSFPRANISYHIAGSCAARRPAARAVGPRERCQVQSVQSVGFALDVKCSSFDEKLTAAADCLRYAGSVGSRRALRKGTRSASCLLRVRAGKTSRAGKKSTAGKKKYTDILVI